MTTPILATKLYIPPPRPELVARPRLIERLDEAVRQNQGFGRKLTLISAPAGFGKTTLISEWVQAMGGVVPPIAVAWLSLDEGDNDPIRFLSYFIAALKQSERIAPTFGKAALGLLASPQLPPAGAVLTSLINEIAALTARIILVLDDYHLIEDQSIHEALTFTLEHLPPHMHLVIATREDPPLPLARLRAQGQLTELRAADLRFSRSEAAGFLNQVMGLDLPADDIAALETRTEGWIAGLQLAALALQGTDSMRGTKDTASFIHSFTGSHRFVLDYLVEEVLGQQSESLQAFLLRTSILDRMCGPLCDAVVGTFEGWNISTLLPHEREAPLDSSDQRSNVLTFKRSNEILEYLERANLFIVPLDDERRWYRYHHLFADLLRQRLQQGHPQAVAELHTRASQWYEDHGLEIEAFHHAVAAADIERAARLVEGDGMPLQFRGAVAPVLDWLASLPAEVLDARPALWVMYASALSMTGQIAGVEEKLRAAEAALGVAEPDEETRNLIGHIAAIRALLAAVENQPETIIAQSRRALEYLHPGNLAVRTATIWKLGIAYHLQGDRAAASQAYSEAMSISQASGNIIIYMSAAMGLGQVQESENQLHLAAETYRRILELAGDQPRPASSEAHLGLARIFYEWNDLDAAQEHGQKSLQLARPLENTDRFVPYQVFLARQKLAQGDPAGAAAMLVDAERFVRQRDFVQRVPEVAAEQVLVLLRQGDLAAAADLAEKHELPVSQARVRLARGDPSAALALLGPLRQQAEAKGWADERLKVMILQAVALHVHGEKQAAMGLLREALALGEPGGFIRTFVDQGEPMRLLILDFRLQIAEESGGQDHNLMGYLDRILAAFVSLEVMPQSKISNRPNEVRDKSPMVEPLSQRELEVLRLIAQGLSNREIGERLFLTVNTVKGHNRRIFAKLQVQRRTEAVARARQLGLL